MIYTFGDAWKSLLNHYVIFPRWGLRIVSSKIFFNPSTVREISARYYRNAIPSMHKERSAKVANLETFSIEVGSEGI